LLFSCLVLQRGGGREVVVERGQRRGRESHVEVVHAVGRALSLQRMDPGTELHALRAHSGIGTGQGVVGRGGVAWPDSTVFG
jgi:hypothetical protein